MSIPGAVLSLLLLPLAVSLRPPPGGVQFVGPTPLPPARHPLCEMGCKCPAKGDPLLDCRGRGLTRLPTFHLLLSNRIASSSSVAVEELDLSSNKIARIDNATFAPFRSLTLLRLSHNHLEEIGPALLEGLDQLRVLEAGHNSLRGVVKEAFRTTPRLLELRLQYNPLFTLPPDLLQYLPQLQRLDLQDTGLVSLPGDIFLPTRGLQWLSLSHNAFERVPVEAMSKAPQLEFLDLSANDFVALVRGDFGGLSRISLLYLNNLSRLSRVEEGAFVGLARLKSLSLSYNPRLDSVHQGAFGNDSSAGFPRDQLYLRQNALRSLPPLPLLQSPSFVDLADNPWRCDCTLLWMKQLLKKETQENMICDSPSRLRGLPFSAVASPQLSCQDQPSLPLFVLTLSAVGVLGVVVLAAGSAAVCSRTPAGLWVRARRQFSYAKVVEKKSVDLEWDPWTDI